MYRFLLSLIIIAKAFIVSAQEQPPKVSNNSIAPKTERNIIKDTVFITIKPLKTSPIKIATIDSLRSLGNYELHAMRSSYFNDPLKHIKATGFKFLLRELAMDYPLKDNTNDSITNAVNILFNYIKNDSIQHMVKYLKRYIRNKKIEEALRTIKKQIAYEKTISNKPPLTINEDIDNEEENWNAIALERVYNYIEKDSAHQWIRKISRDSLLLGVRNHVNDSIKFWINTGKQDFRRFWLKKNKHDSIGIWIQNTNDRSIRILVDNDVYQQSVQASKQNGIQTKIPSALATDYYQLAKPPKYKRYQKNWKTGIITGLYFNQGFVSKSWSRGGESSIAITATLNAYANYKKERHSWENRLEMKYGLLKSGYNKFRKNEDRLEINTKYGQKAVKNWYYSAQFNLKTQIAKGYNYSKNKPRTLVSRFLSPVYIITSLGMDYKPNSNLSVLISPLSAKYTIVSDTVNINQTTYGVSKYKKIKKEIGAYINVISTTKIWKDFEVQNRVTLYTNYVQKTKNIDIDWEMIVNIPINQYLSTKIATHLISDDNTSSKLQFRENFALGISYIF